MKVVVKQFGISDITRFKTYSYRLVLIVPFLFGTAAILILNSPKIQEKLLADTPTRLPRPEKMKKYPQVVLGLKPNKTSL